MLLANNKTHQLCGKYPQIILILKIYNIFHKLVFKCSCQEMFYEIVVMKFAKNTRKHHRPSIFLKRLLRTTQGFFWEICEIFQNSLFADYLYGTTSAFCLARAVLTIIYPFVRRINKKFWLETCYKKNVS